jgi:hypothetical protein
MSIVNSVILGRWSDLEVGATCAASYSSYVGARAAGHNLDPASCGTNVPAIENALMTVSYWPIRGGAAPCTLVGMGTSVGAPTVTRDGVQRPSPPSIGCYEPM